MNRPSVDADIAALESAFLKARGDLARLAAIDEVLQNHNTPRARILRLKVIAAKVALRPRVGSDGPDKPERAQPPVHSPSAVNLSSRPRPLQVLLAKYGLQVPDGRPLHAYRLDAATHASLEQLLQNRAEANRLRNYDREDAALFVIWAAEWFRREYRGGLRKYEEFGDRFGVEFEQQHWRELIEEGLRWWGREVVVRASGRHRLLTLALEGGFPARVLEERGDGWLVRYLTGLVGRLLAVKDPDEDAARGLAWERREGLRATYQTEEFCALAGDLALAVVRLRGEALAAAPSLQASGVLDAVHPGWRETLPIVSEGEAARRLVDGMMSVTAMAIGDGEVGVTRLLHWEGESWRASVRLGLTGEIASNKLPGFRPDDGRVRVHAHGSLARAVASELALLDPPGESGERWLLRPLLSVREVRGVPFTAPIEVALQATGRPAAIMLWPRGEPVLGDIQIFAIDEETGGRPSKLALVGRGSGKVRATRVAVRAPQGWTMEGEGAEPEPLGQSEDGGALWLTGCPLIVTSPDGTLAYRIEPGQEGGARDRIECLGDRPVGLAPGDDTVPLFASVPDLRCFKGHTQYKPAIGEIQWRRGRGEPWRDWPRVPLQPGLVDIVWRDKGTRFVRDRVQLGILPARCAVKVAAEGETQVYTFANLEPFTVKVCDAPGLSAECRPGGALALRFYKQPRRKVMFEFTHGADSRPIRATARFPLRPGLAHWDGERVAEGAQLTPAVLANLVAFGEGRHTLCASLRYHGSPSSASYTTFDDELPLRELARQVAAELRAAPSIDARIDLDFSGASARCFTVRRFDSTLVPVQGRVSVSSVPGIDGRELTLVARPIEAPDTETVLASLSIEDVLNHRDVSLPADCRGAWLVYLRSGSTVRSRPQLVSMAGRHLPPAGGLAAASAIADQEQRRIALVGCIQAIATNAKGADSDLDWLNRLVLSLDGLPALTFDALNALATAPAVLARLLLSGDEAAQNSLWALESELPFLWATVPISVWRQAAASAAQSLSGQLRATPLAANATELAVGAVDATVARARRLDPCLDWLLGKAGLGGPPTPLPGQNLREVASDYVRRTLDRGDTGVRLPKVTSVFRVGRFVSLLPLEFEVFDPQHLETLDAPCAAAIAAMGSATLTPEQLTICRIANATDPIYFAQGFAMMLDRLCRMQPAKGRANAVT